MVTLASRQRAVTALAIVALVVVAAWAAQRVATSRAITRESERLEGVANLAASNFRRQVDTFELVATTLSADPEVVRVLESGDPGAAARLNDRLATLSNLLDASVIYLMDRQGDTIVSSNWRQPDSFVGENYRFRGYFSQAMREGAADQFALGTRSRIPGLFLARRIDAAGRPAGVLVIKIRFDRLEQEWARSIGEAFVSDADGVIIVSSDPKLRFRTISAVSDQRRAELRARQAFGEERLALHPAFAAGNVSLSAPWHGESFLAVSTPAAGNRTLTVVAPVRRAVTVARNIAWLVIALLVSGLIVLAFLVVARRRARVARQEALRQAEADALKKRFEQANRLSSLGQVAAGVGHEINQPLAAIGIRADNAARFLDRGDHAQARAALSEIDNLVARVGAITGELRHFARRADRTSGAVRLGPVFGGLALLMGDAVRQRGGTLTVEPGRENVVVVGEQTRLEQVLVNLVQNALDAGGQCTTVGITVEEVGERVHIRVTDDGPGISDDMARALFQPFTTSKSHGLGLGLVISRDIVAEFGGELSLAASSAAGTTFLIDLERAA